MKKLKMNKKTLIILVAILSVVALSIIGISIAKYVHNRKDNLPYEAKNFYLTSDLLSDSETVKSYNLSGNINKIKFTINNNVDELRYSEVDFDYIIYVTDLQGNSVRNTNGVTVSNITGSVEGNKVSSENIEIPNLPYGTYIVKVKAVSPYEKEIKAVFTLNGNNTDITYNVNDSTNSPVMYLTIKTTNMEGTLKITLPNGIIVNNVDNNFKNISTNYVTMDFNVNSEYSIMFFKENPQTVYTVSDFLVEEVS